MKPRAENGTKPTPSRWWSAQYQDKSIHPVEGVLPFNDAKVKVGGKQELRRAEWRALFPTWDEAHAHLLDYVRGIWHRAERSVEVAQADVARVENMREPQ